MCFYCLARLTLFHFAELENTAPRIKSEFKPKNDDLIQGQKQKRLRKERRIKRAIAVLVGWAIIAWMIYLIIVTARTIPKIYDPYEILGVSRVGLPSKILNVMLFSFGAIADCTLDIECR